MRGRDMWRSALRAAPPYVLGAAGVAVITAAIARILARVDVPNLSVAYVLLILWLGSRHGRGPAVVASILAFAAYDFFLVPPVGTLSVAGPAQMLELVLLLAAALVTGHLAASLETARRAAEAAAAESRDLYELATSALRLPDVTAALELLAERGARLGSIACFTLLSSEAGTFRRLGGAEPSDGSFKQASWAFAHRKPIGCTLRDGRISVMDSRPPRDAEQVVIPLTSGVILARVRAGAPSREADLRMLAALVGLAELLLERRRAILEADRRRAAEASDRLKAAVLSSLSHELKSPIASLRAGITALISPASGLAAEQRELLSGLDRQAVRLDRLVGDLLTMSRLEAGGHLELEARSFPEIAGGVVHRLRTELTPYHLAVSIPPDLPPVRADEIQLETVMANLLENAIEWTPPGGRIEIGAAARGAELKAWIANEGPAIPTSELDSVFDKFWTNRPGGSGLGLAICRRIVEAHGGRIEARNLREGPRFTFTLALAELATPRA